MTDIKFCGLTRPEDAALAATLGARYLGVIFAGGPRRLTPTRAVEVLEAAAGHDVVRVGVFGHQTTDLIMDVAEAVGLDAVQLAGGVRRDLLVALRTRFAGRIWGVAHTAPQGERIMPGIATWFEQGCDAVVLDAAVAGKLGGTGVTLDWAAMAHEISRMRALGRVVLAGGLRPENVTQAIRQAAPDVVDVSSGVESAPGIKDPERMRAFAAAVHMGEDA